MARVSKANRNRLLRKIQRRILKEPSSFRMDVWNCGTAACIGGYACLLGVPKIYPVSDSDEFATSRATAKQWIDFYKDTTGLLHTPRAQLREYDTEAQKILGLTAEEAHALFHVADWPDQYNVAYEDAGNRRAKAKVAAARIEHFIQTGD